MEVDQGEVVVIFGRSGSGKSTLLRCVNFLEDPTSGMIEVAGVRLEGGHRTKGKREQVRQLRIKAGMVFQQFNLFPNMTVIENVIEGPVTVKGIPEARRGRMAWNCSTRSGSPTRPTSTRSGCQAVSSSGWRSPGRWPWSPRSCSSTSPPRRWTPS